MAVTGANGTRMEEIRDVYEPGFVKPTTIHVDTVVSMVVYIDKESQFILQLVMCSEANVQGTTKTPTPGIIVRPFRVE